MKIKNKRRAFTGFGAVLLFALAFAIFFRAYFKTIEVSGESMEPTLRSGQRVLVSDAYGLIGAIRKNDIVVLKGKAAGEFLIKRVHALGGQTVDWLNVPGSWRIDQGKYVVPDGEVYVIGDNYQVSEDSRRYGPFPLADVVGKVVVF
ncbi:MAG TPA: signal peptidase I [Fimbriimonadaceae bacterium]|nr:signal peptidase I [Fimbriimonadaceae bacterium]HRJ96912.1 signal peptidase I [Fimbriimonadaceae bacterium]